MIKTLMLHISISDKCCSSELSIHQRNLKKFNSAVFNTLITHELEQQIRILESFPKDHMTGVMNDTKNSALQSQE